MLETLINILAIIFMVGIGGFLIVFVGNLLLSAFGKNQKGVFFKSPSNIKKGEEISQRPALLEAGQVLDINNTLSNDESQVLTGEARAARLEELLGSIKPQVKAGIDEAAAQREKLLADKKMANNEFELDDDFDFDENADDNSFDIKDRLLKHLRNDNTVDVAKRKTLAELEQEAIEENKLREKGIFSNSEGANDKFAFDFEDENDEEDEDLELESEEDDDFLKDFKKTHNVAQDVKKAEDLNNVLPVPIFEPQNLELEQKIETVKLKKKEETEKIKRELEAELVALRKEKELLEKEKTIKIKNEVAETEKLRDELNKQKAQAEEEKQKLTTAMKKLEAEKKIAQKSNKTNEDNIKKQTEDLVKNLKKMEELKNQLEIEIAKNKEEKQKLEKERLNFEVEKTAILSKKKADEDDSTKLKKVVSFGLASEEVYEKHIVNLNERLKANEKELKRTKKEYIPLDKVRRTLENDKKKLRTKEAIVAKKKVMLYGVNNYVDINDEHAKELSRELDLLEGLRLSVQNCEEVLQKNKDRLPILEANYNLLKDRDEDFKREIAEYENALELFKSKK
ncbi:MAG: hypothetical protein WCX32_01410 [Clostridia bacterium]|jgi:hypothetical protein|nr:hypothetical protein [Clostridia bacterium]MDD4276047.1 hypothetical protein [Clostridia bacterium]